MPAPTNPIISEDTLLWLKGLCDQPAKASDTAKQLRWKAAQRDVYLRAKAVRDSNLSRENTATVQAENLNVRVRSED